MTSDVLGQMVAFELLADKPKWSNRGTAILEGGRDILAAQIAEAIREALQFHWQPIETVPTLPAHVRTSGMCLDDDKLTWWEDGVAVAWMPRPPDLAT